MFLSNSDAIERELNEKGTAGEKVECDIPEFEF
jgi:hypothetical protein